MNFTMTDKSYIFAEPNRPFRQCHASTLAVLTDGTIVSAWFGGTVEGDPDVDIWGSVRKNGVWSPPFRFAGEPDLPHWNPVLFESPDGGILYLFYKVGHHIPEWYTRVCTSTDGGLTWSKPIELVEGDRSGGRGPVKNKMIVLQDGTWLAPASVETATAWDAFVDRSRDNGRSWTPSSAVPLQHAGLQGLGIIQPTLWESEPGIVHMLLRSTEGAIYRSDSKDGGTTWCEAYATSQPNNNSGIDLAKLEDGQLFLVHNPVAGNWAARTPLVLSRSSDNGCNWEEALKLESEPGEFSYPAIVTRNSKLYVTYTSNRETIAFWEIALD